MQAYKKVKRGRTPRLNPASLPQPEAQTLKDWMQSATMTRKKQLAIGAGTTVNYLRKIVCGYRRPSMALALKLVATAKGLGAPLALQPFIDAHKE